MKYDIDTMRSQCDHIEEQFWAECIDKTGKSEAIADGIINLDKYYYEPMRILWILKEPYDDEGGGWSFSEAIMTKPAEFAKKPTFQPIIYVCYAILNGFLKCEDMDWIRDDPEMAEVLQRIAYINMKKLPGKTTTPTDVLTEAYSRDKSLLLRQIETYEPNIIIGGHTLSYFHDDLGPGKLKKNKRGSLTTYQSEDQIYLDAHHPVQRQYTREVYVDDIVQAVKQWRAG